MKGKQTLGQFINWQCKHQSWPFWQLQGGSITTGAYLWAHASHASGRIHSHRTSHVWMSCCESQRQQLVNMATRWWINIKKKDQYKILQCNSISVFTLRSGGVQAVWQEGLWPRDAPRRLIWHTEGRPGASWVPWRHEWLQEGHWKDDCYIISRWSQTNWQDMEFLQFLAHSSQNIRGFIVTWF